MTNKIDFKQLTKNAVSISKDKFNEAKKYTNDVAVPKLKEKAENAKDFTNNVAVPKIKETAIRTKDNIKNKVTEVSTEMKKNKIAKKEAVFQSVESLQQVINIINEAANALDDPKRTIKESAIPEVLTGALGAGIGSAISFTALYFAGTTGLSAVGITSGLAAVGGGMVAGIFVLAAPIAALAGVGVFTASYLKSKQLRLEKERIYQEALSKHNAIINALREEVDATNERVEYLNSLNILLGQACKDLKNDIDIYSDEVINEEENE